MHPLVRILLSPILFPLSLIYRLLFLLDQALTKKRELANGIVISIGNFSVGGTGKTPFTLHLARLLRSHFPDTPIVILSRGYGSEGSGARKVEENSDPKLVGDEPLLLKKNLPFAEVFVGRNRSESYREYRQTEKIPEHQTVFALLDDGFQHHALKRDMDIVLLDTSILDRKDFLLPLGLLREPYSSVSRAEYLIASKFEKKHELLLARWSFRYKPKHILKFSFLPDSLEPISPSGKPISLKDLEGKSVFAFCGIGNPSPFFDLLNELKVSALEHRIFSDHHSFSESELSDLENKTRKAEFVVCTEKDAVKILSIHSSSRVDFSKWYFLKLGTRLEGEDSLIESVRSLKNRAR